MRSKGLKRYEENFKSLITKIEYCANKCCYKNVPIYKNSKKIGKHGTKVCHFYCPECKKSKYWK